MTSISRRHFLKTTAASGLLLSAAQGQSPLEQLVKPAELTKARNLIFLVSDGMNQGTLSAANTWLNLHHKRDCEWFQLYKDGVARRSLAETWSASSIVTDSAAASSAWGCGQRVPNRSINYSTEGKALTPLYHLARQRGKKLGLVSTARITHATPAGFATQATHRDSEDKIADQYLDLEVDVLLGGGSRHFAPATRKDGTDLFALAAQKHYQIARTKDDLTKLNGQEGKLLGTFCPSHVPFYVDRTNDPVLNQSIPSLEAMMAAALQRLRRAPEGFLLQVEAGRIDHAGHDNDPVAIVPEQLEFDRCIALARRFAKEVPDTLVIITTDHGTGGFMLNGAGKDYNDSEPLFRRLAKARFSFEYFEEHAPADASPDDLADQLCVYWQLQPSAEVRAAIVQAMLNWREKKDKPGAQLRLPLLDTYAVNWTTSNHTGEAVELASFGPSSEAIPGFLENWQLHHLMREALGI